MADQVIFNRTISLDVAADVSIDVAAGQGYTTIRSSNPWLLTLTIDGVVNSQRGGSGDTSTVIGLIGAAGQLPAGDHQIQVLWSGSDNIQMGGAVLRIMVMRR